MNKNRLETFSDGVIAIIITIMVLEMKIPKEATWEALCGLAPVFMSYLLSFVFVAIYWGNHHHLMHTVKRISSGIIWSNINLLFWLSLVPFGTGWMGENNFEPLPVAVYAFVLNAAGLAYYILQQVIVKCHTLTNAQEEVMKKQQRKGIISLLAYTSAIPLAWVNAWISGLIFLSVAVLWIIPDKNIEKVFSEQH